MDTKETRSRARLQQITLSQTPAAIVPPSSLEAHTSGRKRHEHQWQDGGVALAVVHLPAGQIVDLPSRSRIHSIDVLVEPQIGHGVWIQELCPSDNMPMTSNAVVQQGVRVIVVKCRSHFVNVTARADTKKRL